MNASKKERERRKEGNLSIKRLGVADLPVSLCLPVETEGWDRAQPVPNSCLISPWPPHLATPHHTHHQHGYVAQVLAVQGTDVRLAGTQLAALGAPAPRSLLAPPGCHGLGTLSPVSQRDSHRLRQVSHAAATWEATRRHTAAIREEEWTGKHLPGSAGRGKAGGVGGAGSPRQVPRDGC